MDDLKQRLRTISEVMADFHKSNSAQRISNTTREAAAALDAKDAEIARITAIANRAIDEWASWVHDQLDGTSSLAEAIAEVDEARAALTPPHVQHTAGVVGQAGKE